MIRLNVTNLFPLNIFLFLSIFLISKIVHFTIDGHEKIARLQIVIIIIIV